MPTDARRSSHEWTGIEAMRGSSRPATSSGASQRRFRTREKSEKRADEEPQHEVDRGIAAKPVRQVSGSVTKKCCTSDAPVSHLKVSSSRHRDGSSQVACLMGNAEAKLREQLLIASEKGKRHAVYLLLHQGVNRDRCRGMRGYTPQHYAATRGHLDVLQLLLDFGWSVDPLNDALETPLHHACYEGHAAIAEFLLDKGADVNAVTSDGDTPLFYAARKGHHRVVRLLIRRESNLTIRNRYGDCAQDEAPNEKTELEFAVGREDLERLYRSSSISKRKFKGEVILTQKQRELVLSFLDLRSLCLVSQVCYRWHRASDNPALWRHLGVSRWELLLQSTVGLGAVAPMALLSAGGLQLGAATFLGGGRRPSSCDASTLGGSRFVASRSRVPARRPQTARAPAQP